MPLSFRSKNHGNIAFGFFNIESDMLLLENYFFFADDFCRLLSKTAKKDSDKENQFLFKVYYIADPSKIGDLMGAIHNIRFTGFIGSIYRLFPFPDDPDAFKQNPEGYQTRDIVEKEIKNFAETKKIKIKFLQNKYFHIGSYRFHVNVFHELIKYVDQGGYPRWKHEKRPEYVLTMKKDIQKSRNVFFQHIKF